MLRENQLTRTYPPTPKHKAQTLPKLEEQVHALLTQQLQNLTLKLEAHTSETKQTTFDEGDYADRASKTARQSKRLAMERLWQGMRAEVERALARLEEGTYGLCARCGVTIPEERLLAVPAAAYCIECARTQSQNSW